MNIHKSLSWNTFKCSTLFKTIWRRTKSKVTILVSETFIQSKLVIYFIKHSACERNLVHYLIISVHVYAKYSEKSFSSIHRILTNHEIFVNGTALASNLLSCITIHFAKANLWTSREVVIYSIGLLFTILDFLYFPRLTLGHKEIVSRVYT